MGRGRSLPRATAGARRRLSVPGMSTHVAAPRPDALPAERSRNLLRRPVTPAGIAAGDIALAVIATVLGFFAATTDGVKPPGGTAAGVGMVLVALPVLARRPAPTAGLAALLAADLLNVAAFGEHTRCGAVLPVAAYLGFAACRRARDTRQLIAPVLLLVAIGATTSVFELGASGLPAIALLLGGTILVARIVRRRDLVATDLAEKRHALEAQREQSARLAVESERARIGGDLETAVEGHVATLLDEAQRGNASDSSTFAAIEEAGRAGLAEMRTVVDQLGPAEVAPQRTLADLEGVLAARGGGATLQVDGERGALAPAIEVVACRIVELLLEAIEPADQVQVRVHYRPAAVEVELVTGSSATAVDPAGLAAARERAAAVGGSLDVRSRDGSTRAHVLLPAA
jgi:two-component system, NarL family, sensor histidine kinase UhpB